MKIRCGNTGERNEYWLEEDNHSCVFGTEGKDYFEHYINECKVAKGWFANLSENGEEISKCLWNDKLTEIKGNTVYTIWEERERYM